MDTCYREPPRPNLDLHATSEVQPNHKGIHFCHVFVRALMGKVHISSKGSDFSGNLSLSTTFSASTMCFRSDVSSRKMQGLDFRSTCDTSLPEQKYES